MSKKASQGAKKHLTEQKAKNTKHTSKGIDAVVNTRGGRQAYANLGGIQIDAQCTMEEENYTIDDKSASKVAITQTHAPGPHRTTHTCD